LSIKPFAAEVRNEERAIRFTRKLFDDVFHLTKSGAVFGLKRYARRVMFGAIPFTNSSHLLAIDGSKFVKPVRLPPGRARLCTTPAVTGSLTCTNTVGVVRVVSLTAAAMGVELARITSDRKSSSSFANWRACAITGRADKREP
jgi:hypothetical protein